MSVTSIEKDLDNLTLTLVADFDATPEQVWELWADPRKLERWWGPPTHPATFKTHELTPGGEVTLLHDRTGGRRASTAGGGSPRSIRPPRSSSLDGFADENGNPNDEMPTSP